jgi:23S rRNA (cytosine1962-C5)-methyltransferase
MNGNSTVILLPGRERSLLRRHPWVMSGAVREVTGNPEPGDTVEVLAADRTWLARGAWSPSSSLRVRIWTFVAEEAVDESFLARRIADAVSIRSRLLAGGADIGVRLVNAESDGLPGLVVDRYAGWLAAQFNTPGVERHRAAILRLLLALPEIRGVVDRSDTAAREREGLPPAPATVFGDAPPPRVMIREGAWHFGVDLCHGQKTGFYLDQRLSRQAIAAHCPVGAEVLNAFSYTGGFAVAALAAGAARVVNLDTSAEAHDLARENLRANGLPEDRCEFRPVDVFRELRTCRDARRSFDVIILDPPKFADSKAHVPAAARGYKDINMLAIKLLRPGGWLFTFSCSGGVSLELFQKIVADAALDAGRNVRRVGMLGQPEDHPVALPFPEGTYLKGLICRVGGG